VTFTSARRRNISRLAFCSVEVQSRREGERGFLHPRYSVGHSASARASAQQANRTEADIEDDRVFQGYRDTNLDVIESDYVSFSGRHNYAPF
jgi:hypothetical protein